jgi:hypothetical protein
VIQIEGADKDESQQIIHLCGFRPGQPEYSLTNEDVVNFLRRCAEKTLVNRSIAGDDL